MMRGNVGVRRTTLDRDVSQAETEIGLRCLGDSRDSLLQAVAGLTMDEWRGRGAADQWSIAETVEHLALMEEQFHAHILPRLLDSAPHRAVIRPPLSHMIHATADTRVLVLERDPAMTIVVRGRPSLGLAPMPLRPTGRVAPEDALDRYIIAREQTAVFLRSTPDLRQRVHDQPALGPLDGYQWALFLAAHTDRHIAQILRRKRGFDHALHVPGVFEGAAGNARSGGADGGGRAAASQPHG